MVSPGEVNESILLSIGSGEVTPQKIYLKVDSDKQGYIEYPDGTYQATVAGVIDTTWNHSAGAIRLIVPKNTNEITTTKIAHYPTRFRGDFISNIATTMAEMSYSEISSYINDNAVSGVRLNNNSMLSFVSAKKSKSINVNSCPNLPISNLYKIIDDMYQLYLDGVDLTGGELNLGGTTKAIDLNVESLRHSEINSYYTGMISDLDTAGVTITINAI